MVTVLVPLIQQDFTLGHTGDGTPLVLPPEVVTDKLAFFAQSGAGKTYGAMKLAELMLAFGAQVIALDPVGVWWGLRADAAGDGPGFPILVLGGEHGDVPLAADMGAAVADFIVDAGASVVIDIAAFDPSEQVIFVRDWAERFFLRKQGKRSPVHMFCEEAHILAPLHPEDREATKMLNRIERLCRLGRNYGVGWSIVSQRPQDVHTKVRNQAGTLLALRTIGPHERKAIADWVSDKARNRDEARLIDELPELPNGIAQVWSPAFLRIAARIQIARKVTFDSSATPTFDTALLEPRTLAPVDVDAVRHQLAAAFATSTTDDPVILRARIAELERQLHQREAAPPTLVEVPVLPLDVLHRMTAYTDDARILGDQLQALTATLDHALAHWRSTLPIRDLPVDGPPAKGAALVPLPAPLAPSQPATPNHGLDHAGSREPGPGVSTANAPAHGTRGADADEQADDDTLRSSSDGERALLTVLARFPAGCTPTELAIRTLYAVTGGGFRQALKEARDKKGWIGGTDRLMLTAEGRAAAWEPVVLPTGAALTAAWIERCKPLAAREILRTLIEAGKPLPKEQLAEQSGYNVAGGGFRAGLKRLRGQKVITDGAVIDVHPVLRER